MSSTACLSFTRGHLLFCFNKNTFSFRTVDTTRLQILRQLNVTLDDFHSPATPQPAGVKRNVPSLLLLRCYCRERTQEGSRELIALPRTYIFSETPFENRSCKKYLYSLLFFLYMYMRSSHPVNDLLDGVQADDARAFLIRSCVPGFTLCAGRK